MHVRRRDFHGNFFISRCRRRCFRRCIEFLPGSPEWCPLFVRRLGCEGPCGCESSGPAVRWKDRRQAGMGQTSASLDSNVCHNQSSQHILCTAMDDHSGHGEKVMLTSEIRNCSGCSFVPTCSQGHCKASQSLCTVRKISQYLDRLMHEQMQASVDLNE